MLRLDGHATALLHRMVHIDASWHGIFCAKPHLFDNLKLHCVAARDLTADDGLTAWWWKFVPADTEWNTDHLDIYYLPGWTLCQGQLHGELCAEGSFCHEDVLWALIVARSGYVPTKLPLYLKVSIGDGSDIPGYSALDCTSDLHCLGCVDHSSVR